MKKFSLIALGRRHLDTARRVTSGRSANTVFGGHEQVLRQTVIALAAEQELSEHLNPGEATVFVLSGRIRLSTQDDRWEARVGDLLVVPPRLYSVQAMEDSAILLTVAKTDRAFQIPEQDVSAEEILEQHESRPAALQEQQNGMPVLSE